MLYTFCHLDGGGLKPGLSARKAGYWAPLRYPSRKGGKGDAYRPGLGYSATLLLCRLAEWGFETWAWRTRGRALGLLVRPL